MTLDEQIKRDADRVLVAVYRLSKGDTDRVVSFEELDAEIKAEALFDLSNEQFHAYGQKAWREVQAHREATQATGKRAAG